MEENKTGAIIITLLIVLLVIITVSYKIDRNKYNNGIILLYAKDYNGYKSLIKLSTIASSRDVSIDDLKNNNDSVICVVSFEYIDIFKEVSDIY